MDLGLCNQNKIFHVQVTSKSNSLFTLRKIPLIPTILVNNKVISIFKTKSSVICYDTQATLSSTNFNNEGILKLHYEDLNICRYICFHMKIICWRVHITTPITFWDMRKWVIWNVCLQSFRNNRIFKKLAHLLRNLRTSRIINSGILRIKNTKFWGYNGTSNSGHFRGPSLVAVALEMTVVGRFYYMYIFY